MQDRSQVEGAAQEEKKQSPPDEVDSELDLNEEDLAGMIVEVGETQINDDILAEESQIDVLMGLEDAIEDLANEGSYAPGS